MGIEQKRFGTMPDGREISLYTLKNKAGLSASFTDLGAVWVSMMVPDRDGHVEDVLLGYDDGEGYLKNKPHMGSVVGRIVNRTSKAEFVLGGKKYTLEKNHGENNLHCGPDYFDQRLWKAKVSEQENCVTFTLESPDGDQGLPGNAVIFVTYTLTEDSCVEILYRAVCDRDTPMNLTNHAYFNLAGHNAGPVLSQKVQIYGDFFTPSTADSIPTGEILSVEGTPMDFRTLKEIGSEIDADYLPLIYGKGYDHNWCLNHERGVYSLAAYAEDEKSGRKMEVYTDLPGIQLYTANRLGGEIGKGGVRYEDRGAFCFETQFFPDAVNKPHFPSPIIKASETFETKTGYRFLTGKRHEFE